MIRPVELPCHATTLNASLRPLKHRPQPIVEQAARRVALVPNRDELAEVGIEVSELFGSQRTMFAPVGSRRTDVSRRGSRGGPAITANMLHHDPSLATTRATPILFAIGKLSLRDTWRPVP